MTEQPLSPTRTESPAPLTRMAIAGRTVRNLGKSFTWAWLDVVCQYRRSRIGPWWETVNVVVMMIGLSLVSSTVFGGDMTTNFGYIGLGIIVWAAISSIVNEGCGAFIRNAALITNSNISVDMYVGRSLSKILIVFAHHGVLYFVAAALGLVSFGWISLLAIPGIALLFINGFWAIAVLAFVCARYRDVELIVRNLLQLAFFMTPVFWDHQQIMGHRRYIIDYNPLFYFIEIIRAPLLGKVPPTGYYVVVGLTTIVGTGLAVLTYRSMRRKLAFLV